jgi:hypothetical protein
MMVMAHSQSKVLEDSVKRFCSTEMMENPTEILTTDQL